MSGVSLVKLEERYNADAVRVLEGVLARARNGEVRQAAVIS